MVADWLGPMFGSRVSGALTIAFLLLGDPLGFPSLLFIWMFVALLIGGIIRRRLGAVQIALLVWLTMLPIMASTVFALAQNIPMVTQGGGGTLGGLPPLPSGLTLTNIFEAPIAGKIIKAVLSTLSGNAGGQVLVEQIIRGLVTDLALKPVIMVVGALIGVELGRLVERRRFSGTPSAPKEGAVKLGATLLILCLCTTVLIPSASGIQFGDEVYAEAMVGALDKNGRAYVGDLFTDTGSTLSGMGLSGTDTDGLAAAVVVSQSGVVEEFQKRLGSSSSLGELSSLINLLPPTFAVVVYLDVPKDTASQRSISVSRALSSTYGVDLSLLTSFSMKPESNETGKVPMVTFALYQSSSDIGVLADNYLTLFKGRGGFVDAVKGAVDNGRLVPGKTGDSASGAIFAAGFINVDAIKKYVPADQIPANVTDALGSFMSGSVSFAGGVSFWNHGAKPSGGANGLDLINLLGASTVPSYSPDSDLSLLLAFAPPGENLGGGTETPNVKISTNVPLSQQELDAIYSFLEQMGYVVRVKQGTPSTTDFQLDTSGLTLPLNVAVTKTITGGETATVTVTVENKDVEPMTGVKVDDGASLASYRTGVELVSGSTTGSWDVIPGGESRTITYTVRMDNPGIYTLQPADLSYTDVGVRFSDSSNSVETVASRPFPLLVPFELAALTWLTGSQLLDMVTGRGVIIMSVITLAFVALIVWDGFKSYRRWRRREEASGAPRSVSGDKSEAPQ
ncbi:MAG: BatD family protein [Candidatus Bathyarchaeota archaeon]|nr:BatD family protein [Candidatus Bathyarchaeota archaeon]